MEITVTTAELVEATKRLVEERFRDEATVSHVEFVRRTEKNGGVFALVEVEFGTQQTIHNTDSKDTA